jgi:N-acyl-D-amino-acid deacylase
VDAAGPTNNIAALVGHGTLRLTANGTSRDLSEGALVAMCALAEEAFDAGAVGLSTGLIYVPATYAQTDEIVTLARIAARWRRPYATHMRDEGERLGEALDEAIEIGRRSGARVQISHCKAFGPENKGKSGLLLDTLHRARLAGVDVRGDQYPYTASSTFLVTLLPSAASEGGVGELKRRCAEPEALRRQLAPGSWGPTTAVDTVIIAHADPSTIGRTVEDVAADRSLDPFVAVCALVAEDPGAMVVEHGMNEDDVVAIMADPLIGVGSDNGAPVGIQHPRTWGCFPEFFGRFVRERRVVGWEEGIRKATSATALQFDLAHRGTLQPGSIADICVFDPETIAHPGSYAKPAVTPVGIDHVVLGGRIVVDHGDFTGVRAGAVLRAGRG